MAFISWKPKLKKGVRLISEEKKYLFNVSVGWAFVFTIIPGFMIPLYTNPYKDTCVLWNQYNGECIMSCPEYQVVSENTINKCDPSIETDILNPWTWRSIRGSWAISIPA